MASQRDVRRIAMKLLGATGAEDRFGFGVLKNGKLKHFVWEWNERVDPKKARVPNPRVLVVRVRDEEAKQALLAEDPGKFFTEPHYDGFPAVLVRLEKIRAAELSKLIEAAWRCQAPAASAKKSSRTPA
jgi:hypothetical protein